VKLKDVCDKGWPAWRQYPDCNTLQSRIMNLRHAIAHGDVLFFQRR
jgi:hypothetical protein